MNVSLLRANSVDCDTCNVMTFVNTTTIPLLHDARIRAKRLNLAVCNSGIC